MKLKTNSTKQLAPLKCKCLHIVISCRCAEKTGIMGDAMFMGLSTPPHYNAIDLNKVKERSLSPIMKHKEVRFPPPKKVEIGPGLYKPSENLTRFKYPIYSCEKSPRNNFVVKYTKLHSFVPSPNTYHPELADRVVTLGARKSYK